jgi:hypothetical protein
MNNEIFIGGAIIPIDLRNEQLYPYIALLSKGDGI